MEPGGKEIEMVSIAAAFSVWSVTKYSKTKVDEVGLFFIHVFCGVLDVLIVAILGGAIT